MKVFGFAGWSGSGKTTLVEKLIPEFTVRGLRVSVIKHAHHGFDLDKPGKDSWRHREAGAMQVLMLSNDRWVLMHELRGTPEPTLDEQLRLLEPCDLVLIEGYKAAAVPKMAAWQQWLYTLMSRNSVPATEFFRIPSDRVVELGVRVAI